MLNTTQKHLGYLKPILREVGLHVVLPTSAKNLIICVLRTDSSGFEGLSNLCLR
jgi:hypothetical protein